MKILSIMILIFYLYIITCVINKNDIKELTLVTIILILYLYLDNKYENIEGYKLNVDKYAAIKDCSDGKCYDSTMSDSQDTTQPDNKEELKNISSIKPMTNKSSGNMSNFDGICMSTGNKDNWMKSPSNIQLNSNDGLYTVQGASGPTKPLISDPNSLMGPPIDGVDGSPTKLFMLANNKVSPQCCPSTFSTSTGCLCTTEQQREFINNRGNNVSGCNNNF